MFRQIVVILVVLNGVVVAVAEPPTAETIAKMLSSAKLADHPRLMWRADDVPAVKSRIADDPILNGIEKLVREEADRILEQPPLERELTGNRLLHVSRELLERTMTLGMEFRLTGEKKYAERAIQEMLAAAAFEDWHPAHFLDTAEMTAGMAIGYDWTFDALSDADQQSIREAIFAKGIAPSFRGKPGWIESLSNWNQVCHSGLAMGALAVAEDDPVTAANVIARALRGLPKAMKLYDPDGAYAEGPTYCDYATRYQVMMISSLRSSLGTDFGLASSPGFLKSADFMLHMTGPTLKWFNFSDTGQLGTLTPVSAMWWFAAERRDGSLLLNERRLLSNGLNHPPKNISVEVRSTFPLLPIWAGNSPDTVPKATSFVARGGLQPVALIRSGWDPQAAYFGLKGGSPSLSHGHMDTGSFVFDVAGVRWADDLGMQDYVSLESSHLDLWNLSQDSQRWKVFRLNAASHNVLTVDGEPMVVSGRGKIIASGKDFAIVDDSSVYAKLLGSARRGIRLLDSNGIRIQDEISGGSKERSVRWAMLTRATVEFGADGLATLSSGDKKVNLTSPGAAWKSYSTEPIESFDAPNPGARLVGFEFSIAPGQNKTIVVDASVDATPGDKPTPLSQWR